MVTDPNLIKRGITEYDKDMERLPTLVDFFLKPLGEDAKDNIMDNNDLMVPELDIPYNLNMTNALVACFTHPVAQITSAEILIRHILDTPRNYHH